ncbi:MAG: sigma-54 dependent transcriptional regulator [Candidatus Thiodiazotropha sp. (ex Dulcina madagascariensis)]|nr:sigma-54 dependent transcriptional regulator [Candidatus Thiodiazotropha sp. (ex Dulcina madagascariensis)]
MSNSTRLCLVEDDEIMRASLRQRFNIEDIECVCFNNANEALESLLSTEYAALITDIRLPDMSGDKLFSSILDADKIPPPTIFITGYGTIDQAVSLLKLGANDYITKPFDLDELLDKLREVSPALFGDAEQSSTVLGVSTKMRQIKSTLDRLADHKVDILITGESGVGKEYAARYFANRSNQDTDRPFVALNCAALPEELLEAELFGHEKGAFTGATKSRRGVFEQANGGVLFLDEVGETSPRMQAKLLRSIQEREVQRIGSEEQIPVDLRIVYATNRDLKKMVANGEFREDLYFRINVAHIHIPPLRERKEDISWLAHRIVENYFHEHKERRLILPLSLRYLEKQHWPGNLRELSNAVERACILSPQEVLGPREFGASGGDEHGISSEQVNLKEAMEQYEKNLLQEKLEQHQWRIVETASSLGISRKSLWEKMKRYDISQSE